MLVLLSESGDMGKTWEGEPFELEPGMHRADKVLDDIGFASLLEEASPGDDLALEVPLYSFPDSLFDPEERFPDPLFDEMEVEEDEVGIILALAPADKELNAEVRSHPMGLVLIPTTKQAEVA
jgi:hypothetical protein